MASCAGTAGTYTECLLVLEVTAGSAASKIKCGAGEQYGDICC